MRSVSVCVALLGPANLGCSLLLVDTQSQATTTDLTVITLARKVACALCDLLGAREFIAAETLPTKLGTGDAVSPGRAVVNALGRSNLLMTNVGELDASKNTSLAVIAEASLVLVVRDGLRNWCFTWCESDSCVDNGSLGDKGSHETTSGGGWLFTWSLSWGRC